MVHQSCSKEAFQALIGDWRGILVSDDYSVYTSWKHGRQTCLTHMSRKTKGLSERKCLSISKAGAWILKEFRLLCRMAARIFHGSRLYGALPRADASYFSYNCNNVFPRRCPETPAEKKGATI